MQPQDEEALEQAAWSAFVAALADHLAGTWPAMPERLGERYAAFVDLAVQQALKRGLTQAASVARFVNLWYVWGPAYHDKPGFEWAQAILSAPRPREWVIVHQLVQRSLAELQRLPGARVEPQVLQAADDRVLQSFGHLGCQGAMRPREPIPLPRKACDLEAVDLRVLDDAWHQEYRFEGGEWKRVTVPAPAAVRVDATRAIPPTLALLSQQRGQGAQARLQVRLRHVAVCDGDRHPRLGFSGPHGRWDWVGHETRAVSWGVATRPQRLPLGGPGAAIAEETSPELHQLDIEVCGLRDEGEPIGALKSGVHCWPADQWWLEVQRPQASAQAVLPGSRPWMRGTTRCRIERDGAVQDSAPVKSHFEDGLDVAVGQGVQALASAWQAVEGLSAFRFDATLGLLCGRMACTWGWRHAPQGLAEPVFMRFLAGLELDACSAELDLGGELALHGTRSRIALRVAGQAPLRVEMRREMPEQALGDVMKAAVARWSLPFSLTLEPLAVEPGGLLQRAGPISGSLSGEAGLRSCTHGSSGWEWYVRLQVEPVIVPWVVLDPVLGCTSVKQTLLPAMSLVDWSLG
jgi:hypothetical protein